MTPLELKQCRERLGLSQSSLAREIGVSQNTIARWEQGASSIPGPVERLLQLMTERRGASSALGLQKSGIARDPYHRAILDGLSGYVDPNVFEACAADLLSSDWPGLVPVRGGADEGFDGAVATGKLLPFPLVTTTGTDAKENLRRSLRRAIESGRRPKKAIFATSRRLQPKTRGHLERVAAEFGVVLVQIYEQDWFANALYQNSAWASKLLGVSGRPLALSVIPLSARPALGDRVIGRERELEALRVLSNDAVLVGHPGSGKTFLLRALAMEGRALFLTDSTKEPVANAIRALRPAAIVVDDAHTRLEDVSILRQLRSELNIHFNIIVTTWPAETNVVQSRLSASTAIQLPLLDADTMVSIVNAVGVKGPTQLVALIVHQAAGRPGLAAALAYLSLRGEIQSVVSGEALSADLVSSLTELLGQDPSQLLGAFALGGESGASQETIAAFLQKPIGDVSQSLARIGAAGIIRQSSDRMISVWPAPLRWILVKQVFFGKFGRLEHEDLLDKIPNRVDAVHTLLGASARGAEIPNIEKLLEECNSSKLWQAYTSIGPKEAFYVLRHHPELCVDVAFSALEHCPSEAILKLLDRAIGDHRELGPHPNHPLRKINDWIKRPPLVPKQGVQRREMLLRALHQWWPANSSKIDAGRVVARAFASAFGSGWEEVESDPGRGRKITISQGVLDASTTQRLGELLERYWGKLETAFATSWTELLGLPDEWYYGGILGSISAELRLERKKLAKLLLARIAQASGNHPGVQHRVSEICKRLGLSVDVKTDTIFEIVYPRERQGQGASNAEGNIAAVEALAKEWVLRDPTTLAPKIVQIECSAREAGITYPDHCELLCQLIAKHAPAAALWANSLLHCGASSRLIHPFLVEETRNPSVERDTLLRRCLENKSYQAEAIDALLTATSAPKSLLDAAIGLAANHTRLVQIRSLQGAIPNTVLQMLLSGSDDATAVAAGVGHWCANRKGDISGEITGAWKAAILRSARLEDIEETCGYWLADILRRDADLALQWLHRFLDADDRTARFRNLEIAKKAIDVLSIDQREKVLGNLRPSYIGLRLVRRIVGRDSALYRSLLDMKGLRKLWLKPLEGSPNDAWAEKIQLAAVAGFPVEELVDSSFPSSWSFSGPESAYWTGWREQFHKFVEHPDVIVAQVAAVAVDRLDRTISRCLEQEHAEAVFGD